MKIKQQLKELGCRVAGHFQRLFDPVSLAELAWEKGFVQRSSSQLTGADFVNLLTTEILEEPVVSYEGLCDRLQQLNPAVTIHPAGPCPTDDQCGCADLPAGGFAASRDGEFATDGGSLGQDVAGAVPADLSARQYAGSVA
jgi:hypothetical protein